MLLTQQHLPVMCEICCDIFCLPAKQCVSSMSEHSFSVSVSNLTSEAGDTHVYFIRPVAPTPRSEASEVQNVYKNS